MSSLILPDPIIFARPLHVWLGLVLFILVALQILTGKRIIKAPLWFHTRLNWKLIVAVALVHGWYGFQIYFLR